MIVFVFGQSQMIVLDWIRLTTRRWVTGFDEAGKTLRPNPMPTVVYDLQSLHSSPEWNKPWTKKWKKNGINQLSKRHTALGFRRTFFHFAPPFIHPDTGIVSSAHQKKLLLPPTTSSPFPLHHFELIYSFEQGISVLLSWSWNSLSTQNPVFRRRRWRSTRMAPMQPKTNP